MIGICLSSVSAVPAGDPAWNPSSPPLKFRTASFPSATSSKGLLRETLPGNRSSYATQRVPKGFFALSACQILTTAWRALFNLPSALYAAYL